MRSLKYVGVFIVAGSVGALAALLLAPATGRDTRRRISKRLDREKAALLKQGRKALEEASEYVQDQLEEGSRVVDEASEYVQDQIQQGRRKLSKVVPV